jgi:WD40 repeat protein
MTTAPKYLDSIECSDQPLDISFHPNRAHLVAAALVDGTVEGETETETETETTKHINILLFFLPVSFFRLVHDIRDEENGEDDDDEDGGADSLLSSLALHTQLLPEKGKDKMKPASCRTVKFSTDGQRIYTGGSAGDMCAMDAERACTFSTTNNSKKDLLWRIESATEGKFNPLMALHPFTTQSALLATGDDAGGVRVWDERICGQQSSKTHGSDKRPHGCVLSWQENEDYISGLEHSDDGNTLLATSADGRLSVFDLRMARANNNEKAFRLSDPQDDELLSLKIMKNGRKVVCGTQEGVLSVFSWGTWGDCSDRFPGHPSSIDALLKVDEDTLLTGSSDGWIRVVQIHPDKFLGVLGEDHGGFPIEKLDFNSNRDVVGSVSHDNHVRLFDARVIQEGFGEEEEEEGGAEPQEPKVQKAAAGNASDDDWEDMDDEDNDMEEDSDNSEDSGDEQAPTVNDKRKKMLKTDTDKFFDDL